MFISFIDCVLRPTITCLAKHTRSQTTYITHASNMSALVHVITFPLSECFLSIYSEYTGKVHARAYTYELLAAAAGTDPRNQQHVHSYDILPSAFRFTNHCIKAALTTRSTRERAQTTYSGCVRYVY